MSRVNLIRLQWQRPRQRKQVCNYWRKAGLLLITNGPKKVSWKDKTASIIMLSIIVGGSVDEWLGRYTWNPEVAGLSPLLTTKLDLFLGRTQFNSLVMLVNSQLVCLPPVETYYRAAINFCGIFFWWISDFLDFARTNFCHCKNCFFRKVALNWICKIFALFSFNCMQLTNKKHVMMYNTVIH